MKKASEWGMPTLAQYIYRYSCFSLCEQSPNDKNNWCVSVWIRKTQNNRKITSLAPKNREAILSSKYQEHWLRHSSGRVAVSTDSNLKCSTQSWTVAWFYITECLTIILNLSLFLPSPILVLWEWTTAVVGVNVFKRCALSHIGKLNQV